MSAIPFVTLDDPRYGEAVQVAPYIQRVIANNPSKFTYHGTGTYIIGNSGTHAVNATLYKSLPYDAVADFIPVSQLSTTGMVVAANAKLPGTSIQDLAAYAKTRTGGLNIAIPGATGELAGDALWKQLGIKMTNIQYKGSAPSELAVVSGEAAISMLTPLATQNHLQTGRMKA